tara:strand:- start:2758 stop:3183 length:426 start_codon:yes stop_codon:yes gene_type:complete
MEMAPTAFAGKERPEGFYAVCLGMLGVEASIAFSEFVEKYELVLSAEDVLDDWKESKDKVKNLGAEGQGALIVKLGNHFADNEWTTKQAKNAAAFAGTLGDELLVHFWNQCVATQKVPNIQKLHKLLGQRVVEAVKASREV